jgi:hypothetical protein
MKQVLKSRRRELSEITKIERVDALDVTARCALQEQRVVDSGATPSPGAHGLERAQIIFVLKRNRSEVGQDIVMHNARRLIGLNARPDRKARQGRIDLGDRVRTDEALVIAPGHAPDHRRGRFEMRMTAFRGRDKHARIEESLHAL